MYDLSKKQFRRSFWNLYVPWCVSEGWLLKLLTMNFLLRLVLTGSVNWQKVWFSFDCYHLLFTGFFLLCAYVKFRNKNVCRNSFDCMLIGKSPQLVLQFMIHLMCFLGSVTARTATWMHRENAPVTMTQDTEWWRASLYTVWPATNNDSLYNDETTWNSDCQIIIH
jgi:hypothetical protein